MEFVILIFLQFFLFLLLYPLYRLKYYAKNKKNEDLLQIFYGITKMTHVRIADDILFLSDIFCHLHLGRYYCYNFLDIVLSNLLGISSRTFYSIYSDRLFSFCHPCLDDILILPWNDTCHFHWVDFYINCLTKDWTRNHQVTR